MLRTAMVTGSAGTAAEELTVMVVLAARDLFKRDGYRPTTIAAIAARAGVPGTGSTWPRARDVLWNYLAIDHYERLVLGQRWSRERYARRLARAITGALCP
jgi:hypothetical protein